MKRTELKPGKLSLARGSTFAVRGALRPKRSVVSPASPAQRAKVAGLACVVCAEQPCDPTHLIPRGITTIGQDNALAVVPMCRRHHRQYDTGILDALPYLEPAWRAELAFAVERLGLLSTVRRVTNGREAA